MENYRLQTLALVTLFVGMQLLSVNGVDFKPCPVGGDEKKAPVIEVRLQDCTQSPCVMQTGGKYLLEIDFEPTISSDTLVVNATGKIGGESGLEVPWIGMKTNGCVDGHVPCPIEKGQKYTYKYELNILGFYPALSADAVIRFSGGEGNHELIACIEVPVQLKKP